MSAETIEIKENEKLTPLQYLAVRQDGLSFADCANECIKSSHLLTQIDRLYGTSLVARKSPIVRMIDEATGKTDDDMQTFLRFVWNMIFIRVPLIAAK